MEPVDLPLDGWKAASEVVVIYLQLACQAARVGGLQIAHVTHSEKTALSVLVQNVKE